MGARPSSFKKGGGFLNGVDGVITDYQFTDEFNGEAFKPGKDPKTKKERFHALYCVLSARVDGADEDVTTTLFAGGADDFSVSDDGHVIWDSEYESPEAAAAAENEARSLGANTAFGKFMTSLVAAGFPETNLPEFDIDYTSVIGTRVRFVQRTNVDDTKKLGKRKDRKTGKEYDRQDLLVENVYALPGTQSAAPAPTTKAPAGKPAAKAGKVSKPAAGEDLKTLSGNTLVDILNDAGGSIVKSKVSMKVLSKLMRHAQREDVRKFLFVDKNLKAFEAEGLISFDQDSSTISLPTQDDTDQDAA